MLKSALLMVQASHSLLTTQALLVVFEPQSAMSTAMELLTLSLQQDLAVALMLSSGPSPLEFPTLLFNQASLPSNLALPVALLLLRVISMVIFLLLESPWMISSLAQAQAVALV